MRRSPCLALHFGSDFLRCHRIPVSMSRARPRLFSVRALVPAITFCLAVTFLRGAETNAPSANSPVPAGAALVPFGAEYFQRIQDELLASLHAAEKARAETEATA